MIRAAQIFTVALFTSLETTLAPVNRRIYKDNLVYIYIYIYAVEYHSAKKNAILTFAEMKMDIQFFMLHEISKRQMM